MFVSFKNLSDEMLERKLYVLRKMLENQAKKAEKYFEIKDKFQKYNYSLLKRSKGPKRSIFFQKDKARLKLKKLTCKFN